MIDVLAIIVAGACLIGFVLIVLVLTHPRHGAVPPVPGRAMRQFVDSLPGDYDKPDGTR